jgi:hypothetical protein
MTGRGYGRADRLTGWLVVGCAIGFAYLVGYRR